MCHLFTQLELREKYACKISQLIREENERHGYHMLEKRPEELGQCGGFVLYTDEGNVVSHLVGYIGLTQVGSFLYEAGSLIVAKKYLHTGKGKMIMEELFRKYVGRSIYLVTNVDAVKHISESIDLIEMEKKNIPKSLLLVIEEQGVLLDDDAVFVNQKCYEAYCTY